MSPTESWTYGDLLTRANQIAREVLHARPIRSRWHQRLTELTSLPTVLRCVVRGALLDQRSTHRDRC